MRSAFFAALEQRMSSDDRIWFLTGDLGRGLVDPIFARFPDRTLNCGITEQTMIGAAAGLALGGKIPFVYSIANFVTLRCLEQIRNDVVHHALPVKIVGVGRGRTYGAAGFSHWAEEDLAVLHVIRVPTWVPLTPSEVRGCVDTTIEWGGPGYLQLV